MAYDGGAYDRWLTYHPEDDLPGWVFETVNCDVCDLIINSYEGHDYAEYDIQLCTCEEEE